MSRKMKIAFDILALLIAVSGLLMIGNWKIAIGVFLLIWANNISRHAHS